MGTRSSKYTKWPKGRPDPRILDDEVLGAVSALMLLHHEVAAAHPSTRRGRRAARKRIRLHMKTKTGIPMKYGKPFRPPKFPNRATATIYLEQCINSDGRKFG